VQEDLTQLRQWHGSMPFLMVIHDCWTAPNGQPVFGLAITYRDMKFKARNVAVLLSVEPDHSAVALSQAAVSQCQQRYGIHLPSYVLRSMSDTASAALATSDYILMTEETHDADEEEQITAEYTITTNKKLGIHFFRAEDEEEGIRVFSSKNKQLQIYDRVFAMSIITLSDDGNAVKHELILVSCVDDIVEKLRYITCKAKIILHALRDMEVKFNMGDTPDGCAMHKASLVIQYGFGVCESRPRDAEGDPEPTFDRGLAVIVRCRRLVARVRKSSRLRTDLIEQQLATNTPHVGLCMDGQTRVASTSKMFRHLLWNYVRIRMLSLCCTFSYACLQRALNQETLRKSLGTAMLSDAEFQLIAEMEAVSTDCVAFCTHVQNESDIVSSYYLVMVDDMMDVLEDPSAELIDYESGNYSSSVDKPIRHSVIIEEFSDAGKESIRRFRSAIERRLTRHDDSCAIASRLDPRTRKYVEDVVFNDDSEYVRNIDEQIRDLFIQTGRSLCSPPEPTETASLPDLGSHKAKKRRVAATTTNSDYSNSTSLQEKNDLNAVQAYSSFLKVGFDHTKAENRKPGSEAVECKSVMDMYHHTDIAPWVASLAESNPIAFRVLQKHLGFVVSSSFIERVFSTSGRVCRERPSLRADTFEMFTLLKHNRDFIVNRVRAVPEESQSAVDEC